MLCMETRFASGEKRPEFVCKLCENIVKDPIACKECDVLYCGICVQNLSKS
jgi:hypothetical protein